MLDSRLQLLKKNLSTIRLSRTQIFLISLLVVFASYFLYAKFVLAPHTFRYFSLIDDGQTIQNSQYLHDCVFSLNCGNAKSVVFESQFGRFRPGYWFIQAITMELFGLNATVLHVFRIYAEGLGLLLLFNLIILRARGSWIAHIFGSALLFTSFSFTENFIRLGPVEPYQVMALAFFSLVYFSQKQLTKVIPLYLIQAVLLISVLFLFTIKETSLALLPVLVLVIGWNIKKYSLFQKLIIVCPFVMLLVGRYLSKPLPNQTSYIESYSLNISDILKNTSLYFSLISHSLSPFFLVVIILFAFGYFIAKQKPRYDRQFLYYWALIFVFFTAILIPWGIVLERYILIVVFSFAVVASILIEDTVFLIGRELTQFPFMKGWQYLVYSVLVLFVLSNAFSYYLAPNLAQTLNYAHWYATYVTFEHDEVQVLAKLPQSTSLDALSSLDNWEVLYEIPLHLHFFYQEDRTFALARPDYVQGEYIFTTSSLLPSINGDDLQRAGYKLQATQEYDVSQIDVDAFSREFRYRPLQALINPPIGQNGITHTWSLFKKQE